MIQRDRHGRFRKVRVTTRWDYLVCLSILGGIFLGMYMDAKHMNPFSGPIVYIHEAEAKEEIEVKLEVNIDWTKERIVQEIRKTFPETPNTAVAIATEEGGLHKVRQSDIYKNGIREPSFCTFQIHEPSWGREAKKLGYGDYKTNPAHCIAMARYIYDNYGQKWTAWSAYNNGSYRKHL